MVVHHDLGLQHGAILLKVVLELGCGASHGGGGSECCHQGAAGAACAPACVVMCQHGNCTFQLHVHARPGCDGLTGSTAADGLCCTAQACWRCLPLLLLYAHLLWSLVPALPQRSFCCGAAAGLPVAHWAWHQSAAARGTVKAAPCTWWHSLWKPTVLPSMTWLSCMARIADASSAKLMKPKPRGLLVMRSRITICAAAGRKHGQSAYPVKVHTTPPSAATHHFCYRAVLGEVLLQFACERTRC